MKLYGIFALIGFSYSQRVCSADDVVLSMRGAQYLADKMQLVTDTNNNNIDPSGVSHFFNFKLVYRNQLLTECLSADLQQLPNSNKSFQPGFAMQCQSNLTRPS